jgi:uncharacterized protein (TIGR02466 family)
MEKFIENIFPTTVVGYMNPNPEETNAKLIKLFDNEKFSNKGTPHLPLEDTLHHLGDDLSPHPQQTDDKHLENREEYKFFYDWVNECLIDFKESTSLYTEGLRVSLSWANKSTKSKEFVPHMHPNSWYSAIYYVTENISQTYFKTPVRQSLSGIYVQSNGVLDRDDWVYNGPAGSMILFPSWLEHFTHPYDRDDERITLSFNIMPYGVTSPYYLSENVY